MVGEPLDGRMEVGVGVVEGQSMLNLLGGLLLEDLGSSSRVTILSWFSSMSSPSEVSLLVGS